MKKIISIVLFISMTLSFSSCKKTPGTGGNTETGQGTVTAEAKETLPEPSVDYLHYINPEGEKEELELGNILHLYENKSAVNSLTSDDVVNYDGPCTGPLGVKAGCTFDELVSVLKIEAGKAAILRSSAGYENFEGSVTLEDGKRGTIYTMYARNYDGEWEAADFESIKSFLNGKMLMNGTNKLLLIGSTYTHEMEVLYVGVMYGQYNDIMKYLNK